MGLTNGALITWLPPQEFVIVSVPVAGGEETGGVEHCARRDTPCGAGVREPHVLDGPERSMLYL